jgi:hypothetical protein
MPKIYEDEVVKGGDDPVRVRQWAEANGHEWVPSQVMATPAWGRHPSMGMPEAAIQPRRVPIATPNEQAAMRSDARLQVGLGLPLLTAGAGVPGAIMGAVGQIGAEGLDYAMSNLSGHPEEAPSGLGAGLRTGAQLAVPYGLGKVGEAIAPLARKMQPVMSKLPKIATEKLVGIGNAIKGRIAKIGSETTTAKLEKDALMEGLRDKIPALPVQEFIERLRAHMPMFKAPQDELEGLISSLYSKVGGPDPILGSITLDDLQAFVREGYNQVKSPQSKHAMGAFYKEFLDSTYNHIAASDAGPITAQRFLDLTEETGSRLRAKEAVEKEIGEKGAVGVAKHFMTDDFARKGLKELDAMLGSDYAQQIEELARESAAIEKRAGEVMAGKAANAELLALQKKARVVLYGLAGTIGGAAFRSAAGGGSGFLGGEAIAWLFNRFVGEAMPFERAIAGGISGVGKASPYMTPLVTAPTREDEPPRR